MAWETAIIISIVGMPLALTYMTKHFVSEDQAWLRFVLFVFNLWWLMAVPWVGRIIAKANDADVTRIMFSLTTIYLYFAIALTVILLVLFLLQVTGLFNKMTGKEEEASEDA